MHATSVQMVFTSRNTSGNPSQQRKDDGREGHGVPCAEHSATWNNVGETVRMLRVHMTEHRRAVKNKDPKNGIAMLTINWQEAKILWREDIWGR